MNKSQKKKFMGWWKYMNTGGQDREQMLKWLKFACKTAALRGDQNQQRLVYTTTNRFKHSEYPLKRWQAQRVFSIINKKQDMYKRIRQQLEMEYRTPTTVVKTIRKRTIAQR